MLKSNPPVDKFKRLKAEIRGSDDLLATPNLSTADPELFLKAREENSMLKKLLDEVEKCPKQ